MRVWLLALLATAGLASSTACGSDSNPTDPSGGSGTSTLTIVPVTDFLTVGSTAMLQARLAVSGSSSVVSADWSSDDGRVAAIDRQGLLTALASGTTTVRAAFDGRSAAMPLRVAPNYAGVWAGARRVANCVHPVPDFCTANYPPGSQFATRLTLSQVRDRVSGTLLLSPPAASPTAAVLGDIATGGQLPLAGSISASATTGGPLAFVGSVADWRSEIDPVQSVMLGGFVEQRVDPNGTTWRVTWELLGLARAAAP